MASNPFLDAINNAPNPLPNFSETLKSIYSSIPQPHGVDLSEYYPTMSSFNFSPTGFGQKSSSSTSNAALSAALQQATQNSGGGIVGFLHDLWNRISAPFEGAWAGALADAPKQNFVPGHPGSYQPSGTGEIPLIGAIKGFIHGLEDSNWAHQAYEQQKQRQMNMLANQAKITGASPGATKFNQWLLGTALDTMSNPLTYVPWGKVAQAAKAIPGVEKGVNALKNTASKALHSKPLEPFTNYLGQLFVKYHGASPEVKEALKQRDNLLNFYQETIRNEMGKLAKQHNLTPEELEQLPHVWEGTATGNERIQQAIKDLRNALNNGIGPFAGEIGTNAELRTTINGQPILQRLRQNYFPHFYNDEEEVIQAALNAANKGSISTTGPFNQMRQFNTLREAIDAGLHPEMNPYVAVGQRLMASARAIVNANMINKLIEQGAIRKNWAPGFVKSEVLNSLKWLNNAEHGAADAAEHAAADALHAGNPIQVGDYAIPLGAGGVRLSETPLRIIDVQTGPDGKLYVQFHPNEAYLPEDMIERVPAGAEPSGGSAPNPFRQTSSGATSASPVLQAFTNAMRGLNPEGFSLPKELSKSAPRYKTFKLQFANDFDKAAYIVGNPKQLSSRDADFLSALMNHTGLGESEVRALGRQVRDFIKQYAKNAEPADGVLRLPQILRDIANAAGNTAENASILPETLRRAAGAENLGQAVRIGENNAGPAVSEFLRNMVNAPAAAAEHLSPPLVEPAAGLSDEANFRSLVSSLGTEEPQAAKVSYYIRPADEAALQQAVTPLEETNPFLKAYDKFMGLWRWGHLYNPLIHGHNILYNGVWLGGARPSYIKQAFASLKNGGDEWYQRALRAGAINPERGNFVDSLRKAVSGKQDTVMGKLSYALHGVLWDLDRALRTAIFREAVENGATDAEAAARANKFLIDYNNLTPFEQRWMKRIFPFYSWLKGNLPLQVEQWINNTPKQALYETLKNAVSQALSGQPTTDGKIDTGIRLPDGSRILIDPYVPADEPLKLVREGLPAFLFGKTAPAVKEAALLMSNQKYYPPLFAPADKPSMGNLPLTKPGNPDNAANVVYQLLQNLSPVSAGPVGQLANDLGFHPIASLLGLPVKKEPVNSAAAITEFLAQLAGGFTSRDNPVLDAYYRQRDQQQALQNLISYDKQHGIPIPPALKQAAYAKIPFPIQTTESQSSVQTAP